MAWKTDWDGIHPRNLTYRYQAWPYSKRDTFSKPAFLVSMSGFGGSNWNCCVRITNSTRLSCLVFQSYLLRFGVFGMFFVGSSHTSNPGMCLEELEAHKVGPY